MYTNVPPQLWMMLPKESRDYIVKEFSLTRTGITEILDQQVIRDGYSMDDLKGITLDKMCAFIGSEEEFPRAWELTCAKVKSILHPPVNLEDLKKPVNSEEFKTAVDTIKEENKSTQNVTKTKKS